MIMIGNFMKRLFSAAALVAACTLVHAQGTYTLKGTVKGGEGKIVFKVESDEQLDQKLAEMMP